MEALLNTQKIEVDELQRLIKNYSNDDSERKQKRYLEDKIRTYEESFNVIKRNNREIVSLFDPSKHSSQPYFKEKIFEKIQSLYEWANNDILTRLVAIETEAAKKNPPLLQFSGKDDGKSSGTTSGNATKNSIVNEHNAKSVNDETANEHTDETTDEDEPLDMSFAHETTQRSNTMLEIQYNDLMDLIAGANDLNEESSRGHITTYLQMLNDTWTSFRMEINKQRLEKKPVSVSYRAVLVKYMRVTGNLNDLICSMSQPRSKTDRGFDVKFAFPKIILPEFHGNICEWKGFIALFDKMVHYNDTIDKSMKIELLKTRIQGPAAKIINHLDPVPENYDTCYELIRRRYDNKREILTNFVDNIFRLPRQENDDAEMLKAMHDTVYETMMTAKNMGVTTEQFLDFLICHILLGKLNSKTILDYECQLNDVRELNDLPTFLNYIENRFMALQAVGARKEE